MIIDGTVNRGLHSQVKVSVNASALMDRMDQASRHLVDLSMAVRQ